MLCRAARYGHSCVVEVLLECVQPNESLFEGKTALYFAAEYGHDDVVRLLLHRGAACRPCDGFAPLDAAIQIGHTAVVEALLDALDVFEGPTDISRLLRLAAQNGHLDVVLLLLARGANIHAVRDDGVTALLIAVAYRQDDVVKLLLERGADPNVCRKDGLSPLLLACQERLTNVVRSLLEYKADPNVMCNGKTPLSIVVGYGHLEIVKLLFKHKVKFDKESLLLSARTNGYLDLEQLLVCLPELSEP